MTPENTLGGDSSVPTTEPMPDPVIDPTVPETPAVNPDPVIDPTAPAEPAPAPVVESTPTPVVDPTTSSEPQALGDDPTKSLDQPATPDASTQAPVVEKPKANAKIIGIIIAAVVVLALVIVAIIFLPKLFANVDTAEYDDDAFFAEESNGSNSFAIFKRDGKRVTDFIYSNVSSFTDGHAVACLREDSNKCGIVTSAGTTSLNFGSYDSVSSAGGLYVVTSGNKRILVNYTGQQISELASDENANADLFVRDEGLPLLVHNYGDNKYKLYDSKGKVILDFESTSRPTLFHSNQMAIGFMSTDNKTYAIGANDQSIITDANTEYAYTSVKDISSDGKTLILQTDAQKDKLHHYAIYANEKIIPVNSDECTDLTFAEDTNKTKMNYVNCKIKYSEYAVDEKGNITHGDYTTKLLSADTYIKSEYFNGKLDETEEYSGTTYVFYKDGKLARRIAGKGLSLSSIAASGYYTFYSYDYRDTSNNYRHFYVYNASGEEVFKYDFENSDYYNEVYGLDSNGNYIITYRDKDEAGKTHTYSSVIKPDGTTVIEKQINTLREYHGLYINADYSTIESIMDKNGKQISPDGQTYNDIEMIGNNFVVATKTYQNISHIYSLSGKKLTGDDKSISASVYKNYIAIKEGSKYKYYNVETGEEIYAQ